nr:hypothetical protein [Tanacetum cinerariifolium]
MQQIRNKPHDESSTKVLEGSRNPNPTVSSSNPPADQMETLTVESPIPTVSSPVPTACLNDSPARLISKRVANQEESPSLDNILSLTNRFEDILGITTSLNEAIGVEVNVSNMETSITASPTLTLRIHKDHPKSQIISPVDTPIQTRHKSKVVEEQNPSWVEAMQEELLQFKIQNVWTLVDCPKGVRPIGTKWVLKNKKDERGIVVRNKARLMDVNSAFLYGTIDEEVYVMQPPGFQDPAFLAKVYKVEKAMYGLQQAPRAWQKEDFILFQVYVDDIIFGSSNLQLCREFEALMHEKFQMSAMGELNFFLGLQTLQKEDGIFLSQDKRLISWQWKKQTIVATSTTKAEYVAAVDKFCGFRIICLIMDSDYGGASQDRKSTTGRSQFLGRRLISWQCKKQTIVATSTTEAEYVTAASCCGQVRWIQNQLLNYRHHFIRDSFEKKLISVDHIHTEENVADLLTKPFDAGRF